MLSQDANPVAWAMLVYEIADAHEHLGALLAQMNDDGRIEEGDFAVQLGHVMAHLNRAWHGRSDPQLDSLPDSQRAERSKHPVDLPPVD